MNKLELMEILKKHQMWLKDETGGERAYLQDANLQDAYLQDAYLRDANLQDAYLRDADLQSAYLQGADLRGADLQGAYLQSAYLQGANLQSADLRGADLRGASYYYLQCPETGSFTAYKKGSYDTIITLEIPSDAKRSSATSRKCRANKALVLKIEKNGQELQEAISKHDNSFIYKVGEMVTVDNFDEDRWNECSTGIHFFITRQEAEEY